MFAILTDIFHGFPLFFQGEIKYSNNYAENIRHHGGKCSWLGD